MKIRRVIKQNQAEIDNTNEKREVSNEGDDKRTITMHTESTTLIFHKLFIVRSHQFLRGSYTTLGLRRENYTSTFLSGAQKLLITIWSHYCSAIVKAPHYN